MTHAEFVRLHTAVAPTPLVPEVRLHTATELTPLWHATEAWLRARGTGLPYWCVPWAGGQALARWVLDRPEIVRGRRVVDFGCGSGLVAIAAAKAGAAAVRAVDVDALACAACALNATANDVHVEVVRVDPDAELAVDEDVVLAGDVWYERGPAARFAAWMQRLAGRGVLVLTGDPGRAYAPAGARELAIYDVPTSPELEASCVTKTRVLSVGSSARLCARSTRLARSRVR